MNENSSNGETFLSLRHLEKVYPNGEKAVYDFNLDIAKNEFMVIVGPSGCGKSTTLRMVAGLEDITSGEIYLGDELLNYKPSKDRHMAIVFQSYALYPQMTVFDNIAFPLTINTYPAPVVNTVLLSCAQAREIIERFGLAGINEAIAKVDAQKPKFGERAENLATLLNVVLETAKLILKLHGSVSADDWKNVADKEDGILSDWDAKLSETESAEQTKINESGKKTRRRVLRTFRGRHAKDCSAQAYALRNKNARLRNGGETRPCALSR